MVGWVDLHVGLQAASLTAAGAEAPADLLALAHHNAPSGGSNPGEELRWPGLWSAPLRSGESFAGPVTLAATTVDAADLTCSAPKELELPAASPWRLELQTIVPAGDDPAGGLARIAGTLTPLWGDAPALPEPLTFTLSRYVAGSPGQWVEIAAVSSSGPAWSFTDIPAAAVLPGENLYRVTASGPDGALLAEDAEGFYAVAATESLTTGTNENDHQRRQALVFRDTVREVLNSERRYAEIFPEQLILAIGSAENGMFDNAVTNGNGILQVTCDSRYKGKTEGKACDVYAYTDTAASIKFNVNDGISALFGAYTVVRSYNSDRNKIENCDDPDPKKWPVRPIFKIDNPKEVDQLITAVVYYNNWVNYICGYRDSSRGNRWYLHDVARQLDPHDDDPNQTPNQLSNLPNNQNIAQFFADVDNTAGVGIAPDLVERLDYGQNYINQLLQ